MSCVSYSLVPRCPFPIDRLRDPAYLFSPVLHHAYALLELSYDHRKKKTSAEGRTCAFPLVDNSHLGPPDMLQQLPSEIIHSIAHFIRGAPEEGDDGIGAISCTNLPACLCKSTDATRLAKFEDAKEPVVDEALPFSLTCKRIREAVFEDRAKRELKVGLCDSLAAQSRNISAELRSRVR